MPSNRLSRFRPTALLHEPLERRACPAGLAPAVVTLSPGFSLDEAATEPGILTVSLAAPSTQPVNVGYVVTGSATAGVDYRLMSGADRLSLPTGRITFAPGETVKRIAVTPLDDSLREGDEQFTFTLRPVGGITIVNRAATVTITDDDSYSVTITPIGGSSRLEPGRIHEFSMRLSSPATRMERFYLNTRNGSATAGEDFLPLDRLPVTFRAGESEKRFRVAALANTAGEFDEVFFVTTDPYDAASPIAPRVNATVIGIGPPPPPRMTVSNGSAVEGNAGETPVTFTVTLSSPPGTVVSVNYATADGTATVADNDYIATSGTLTFDPGETSKTVSVMVVGDRKPETDETFTIVLSSPVGATLDGATVTATATATITNDERDAPGFQIDLRFIDRGLGPVPAGVQALARDAADRWSRIIVGDLPGVERDGVFIDDFELTVSMGVLGSAPNGPTGPLANARPTDFRAGIVGLPVRGETGLNPFYTLNIGSFSQRNYVFDILTHEIGHALGFASGANVFRQFVNGDLFTGSAAVREFNALFNQSAAGVPLETGGGGGTAGSHWRESVFRTELMTGYAESPGTRMYISRVTVGAFEDLGYQVDYSAAEPYVRPAGATNLDAVVPEQSSNVSSALVGTGTAIRASGRSLSGMAFDARIQLEARLGQFEVLQTTAVAASSRALSLSAFAAFAPEESQPTRRTRTGFAS